eukprot:690028-Pelagomonas_calceolata.AAC.1
MPLHSLNRSDLCSLRLTGDSFLDFERDDLESKYQHVSLQTAEAEWRAAYENSLENCTHGPGCKQVQELMQEGTVADASGCGEDDCMRRPICRQVHWSASAAGMRQMVSHRYGAVVRCIAPRNEAIGQPQKWYVGEVHRPQECAKVSHRNGSSVRCIGPRSGAIVSRRNDASARCIGPRSGAIVSRRNDASA